MKLIYIPTILSCTIWYCVVLSTDIQDIAGNIPMCRYGCLMYNHKLNYDNTSNVHNGHTGECNKYVTQELFKLEFTQYNTPFLILLPHHVLYGIA